MNTYPVIEKDGPRRVPPNLADYDGTLQRFDWAQVEGELDGLHAVARGDDARAAVVVAGGEGAGGGQPGADAWGSAGSARSPRGRNRGRGEEAATVEMGGDSGWPVGCGAHAHSVPETGGRVTPGRGDRAPPASGLGREPDGQGVGVRLAPHEADEA